MQSETGFPSSHQLKSYVTSKSRLKLAARAVLSADAGLLVFTQVGYIKCYQKDDMSSPKWAWLWSRDRFKICPFAVAQRVARVCQRQLSWSWSSVTEYFFAIKVKVY